MSCRQCRESKRKCVRPRPIGHCNLCKQKGLPCGSAFADQVLSREVAAVPTSSSQDWRDKLKHPQHKTPLGLEWETTVGLVEHYLDKVHDRPHSIFHPPTFWARLRNGDVGSALLCAICAIGSKFSADADRHGLETRLTAEAKRLLQLDLENFCIENIQACILVATLSAGNGEAASEALFVRKAAPLHLPSLKEENSLTAIGIATSMAEFMNLESTAAEGPVVACETARRIWWSIYLADLWCFAGLGCTRRMDDAGGSYTLPMDEMTFRCLSTDQELNTDPWKPGLWAYMVTLVRLFGPIQDLNRRIVKSDTDNVDLDAAVDRLGHQLEAWSEKLPPHVQMTVQSLNSHQQNGLGGLFIALHLAYHHYSTLLYFRFLESQQITKSIYRSYVTRCKHHASHFSSLLYLSRQMKGCEASYPTVSQMTAVSSSVLVHTLLFGDLEEIKKARQELNANFEALVELRQVWPATATVVSRSLPSDSESSCSNKSAPA
jgi:hypothetical protein